MTEPGLERGATTKYIPSASVHAPLSQWISLMNLKFKDNIIKNFEMREQSIKPSSGPLLRGAHCEYTGCIP